MTKKPKKRNSFSSANEPSSPPSAAIKPSASRPIRWDLVALFLLISVGGSFLVLAFRPKPSSPQFTYQIKETYPHDKSAFTQGLVIHDGFLWESTGKKGESSFRKVDLKTGAVLQQIKLDDRYFGEGLTYLDGRFYQLTWQNGVCLVYNEAMEKIKEFNYEGEGWGLTTDGIDLIMSDGTSALRFIDPDTFEEKNRINVRINGFRAGVLNELEYVGGKVFANVWMRNLILEIDPKTGNVTEQIDLDRLWPLSERPREGVLNGIAFHPESKRLLVTGKYAPSVWEIEVVPIKPLR